MAKSEERIKARMLRNDGWSIRGIAKKLKVSKGTVSRWCLDIRLSSSQIKKLMMRDREAAKKGSLISAQNKVTERLGRVKSFGDLGKKKVGAISKRDLFIAGVALYWAEGDKKDRRVKIINSDPAVIRIWIRWLELFTEVNLEDLICEIGINESHKDRLDKVYKYWINETGIPRSQFRKTSLKKVINKKIYENHNNHFGSLMVCARRGTNLNYEILGMIEGLRSFEARRGKI